MYSKIYNPERYEEIRSLLEAISSLEEGGRLTLDPLPKEDRNRVRYLIYDWLYHMSMKQGFRLQEEDGSLIIRRRSELTNVSFQVEQPSLPPRLESILRQLLSLPNIEEVEDALRKMDLEEGEVLLLRRHWKRVMT